MPSTRAGRLLFAIIVAILTSLIVRNTARRLQTLAPPSPPLLLPLANPPLCQAAREGDLSQVKMLLAQGADVNTSGPKGTPLEAALSGKHAFPQGKHVAVVRTLLTHHANPNRYHNNVPISLAIRLLPEVVPDLLDHGVDVNFAYGTPLCESIRTHQPALVEALLRRHAQVNVSVPPNVQVIVLSPLMTALIEAPEYEARLRRAGAKIPVWEKQSTFASLLKRKQTDRGLDVLPILPRLLVYGVNPNGRDVFGATPLMNAIAYAPSAVTWLLAHGANPNLVDSSRLSPLYSATLAGQTDNVRLLLAKGAKPNLPLPIDHSLMYYARKHRYKDIEILLQHAGAKE